MTKVMRGLALVAAAAVMLAACSSPVTPTASGLPRPSGSDTNPISSSPDPLPDPNLSYIATAPGGSLTYYVTPYSTDKQVVKASDVLTVPDATPLVFLVKDITPDWIEVWLPIRPNGSTGFVKPDSVKLVSTLFHVEVDLDAFNLKVYDGDTVVVDTAIGVGRGDRPTPGGVYFIRELLKPPDPTGLYGPYAYGLSGYSPVLDEFRGGDAVIGMHGTDDPTSFGRTVSSGCLRLPNETITKIVEEVGLPLGTPVHIAGS